MSTQIKLFLQSTPSFLVFLMIQILFVSGLSLVLASNFFVHSDYLEASEKMRSLRISDSNCSGTFRPQVGGQEQNSTSSYQVLGMAQALPKNFDESLNNSFITTTRFEYIVSLLISSANPGDLEKVLRVLNLDEINETDLYGRNLLFYTTDTHYIRLLVEFGCNFNQKTLDGIDAFKHFSDLGRLDVLDIFRRSFENGTKSSIDLSDIYNYGL